MNYTSYVSSGGGMSLLQVAGIVLAILIHIVFVICFTKTVSRTGRSGLLYGIIAFLCPEIAFVLFYLSFRHDYDGTDEENGYYYDI